jgi:hypothetical protein
MPGERGRRRRELCRSHSCAVSCCTGRSASHRPGDMMPPHVLPLCLGRGVTFDGLAPRTRHSAAVTAGWRHAIPVQCVTLHRKSGSRDNRKPGWGGSPTQVAEQSASTPPMSASASPHTITQVRCGATAGRRRSFQSIPEPSDKAGVRTASPATGGRLRRGTPVAAATHAAAPPGSGAVATARARAVKEHSLI